MTGIAIAAMVSRGLIELLALWMAYLNLRQVDKLRQDGGMRWEEKHSWSRHFLIIANIWIAAFAVIAAFIIGNLK